MTTCPNVKAPMTVLAEDEGGDISFTGTSSAFRTSTIYETGRKREEKERASERASERAKGREGGSVIQSEGGKE